MGSTSLNVETVFENFYSKLKPGLKDLSHDLRYLYESKHMSDVTIHLSLGSIKCHKAILYARSPVFALLLQNCEQDILTYPEADESVMDVILKYMYTGDLTVFTGPSLRLDLLYEVAANLELRCAKHFLTTQLTTANVDAPPIHQLFFTVNLCNFSSSLINITNSGEYIFPSGIKHGMDEWLLKICSYSVHTSHVFLGVFLIRRSVRRITHVVFTEISLLDFNGRPCLTYGDEFVFTRNTQFGTPLFADKKLLFEDRKRFLPNDTFTLSCHLNIMYEINNIAKDKCSRFKIQNVKEHRQRYFESFRCLSKNLLYFYDQKLYTDFNFQIGKSTYQLHMSILTARMSLSISEVETIFSCLSRSSLERCLSFIYSGKSRYIKRCAINIYSIASTLGFSLLKTRLSELLARSLTERNALRILRKSFIHRNDILKYAAFHFIAVNNYVLQSKAWYRLLKGNAQIALEAESYMKKEFQFTKSKFSDDTLSSASDLSQK